MDAFITIEKIRKSINKIYFWFIFNYVIQKNRYELDKFFVIIFFSDILYLITFYPIFFLELI